MPVDGWRVVWLARGMRTVCFFLVSLIFLCPCRAAEAPGRAELLRTAVEQLLAMQQEDGAWPYEGVYRVGGEIPVGYRVGGTSIVAGTLLHAVPEDAAARKAVEKALAFVLKDLEHPLMAQSTDNTYDVRVWGHACALEFFCHATRLKACGPHGAAAQEWIGKLSDILVAEEIPGGGWNYATRDAAASFVTAPVVQSLLWARAQGGKVPEPVLERARKFLERCRTPEGGFLYSGTYQEGTPVRRSDLPAGSAARSAVCESTLVLLGGGSVASVQGAVNAFHTHWSELHARWKKTGTHIGPYAIAPYYFYYGHRYAAQAIALLPEDVREKERARLLEVILRTRDGDGTWNDRIFPRSRGFGTAMIVLALLQEKTPLPPGWSAKKQP